MNCVTSLHQICEDVYCVTCLYNHSFCIAVLFTILPFSYLKQHFCLFQADNSLSGILLKSVNHILKRDHGDLSITNDWEQNSRAKTISTSNFLRSRSSSLKNLKSSSSMSQSGKSFGVWVYTQHTVKENFPRQNLYITWSALNGWT